MLSDQGADLVMAEIEFLARVLEQSHLWNDADIARVNAMLNHLYDLHKLRDHSLLDGFYRDRYVPSSVIDALWRMNFYA